MDGKDKEVDLLYGNRWESQIKRKTDQMDVRDKELVKRFCAQKDAENVGQKRMLKLVHTIHGWRQFLPDKGWQDLTKEDFVGALRKLNRSNYKEITRTDFRKILKMFFRFAKGLDYNPPETAWIKTRDKKNLEEPYRETIKEDGLKHLIDVCDDTQLRCFISMLGYGGFRIGELLPIKLKDVVFEEHGVRANVTGKTGPRSPLLTVPTPYISAWVALHPGRHDRESYLFITRNETRRPTSYATMRKRVMKYAKKAGIQKANFQWFRASSVTHKLKNGWSLVESSSYHGHSIATTQKHYLKMSSRDTDAAVIREQSSKIRNCPRCQKGNSYISKTCSECGCLLDVRYANEADEQKKFALELLVGMLKDPTKRAELLAVLEKEVNEIEHSASG
jgi:integrase/recombinase XerD